MFLVLTIGCAPSDYDLSYCDQPEVVLNEVYSAAMEEGGETDFIELYNGGDTTVSLAEWGLSRLDFRVEYWFPPDLEIELAPGGWFAIEANTYDRDDGALVTRFDLNRDGAGIWLRDPDGDICDYDIYPDQHAYFSWGRVGDGRPAEGEADWCYQDPSREEGNAACLDAGDPS